MNGHSARRAVTVTALLACLCAPAPAAAAGPADPGDVARVADGLSRRIADAWLARQRPDGSFRDYVADRSTGRRDEYGPALLGAGLLLHGVRTGRDAAVAGGLRATAFALAGPRRSTPFEALGLAVGLRATQAALASDPRRLALDHAWRARLRGFDSQRSVSSPAQRREDYSNLRLVETVAALEGRAAQVRARRPAALLYPPAVTARTAQVVGGLLPALAGREQRSSPDGLTAVISDPPNHPIAYHALSAGLLGRALDTLGPTAPAPARAALLQAARASWALMSPQGDVAWAGRGQSQSWTLAMTALGAVTASRQPGVGELTRARLYAVALRALGRLAAAAPSRSSGIWITPAFALDRTAAIRGLDFYAAAGSYTGLTLVALEWVAADPVVRPPAWPLQIAADTTGHSVVGRSGRFTTVRRGDVWMSVKQRPAVPVHEKADHTHDLRYDAGVDLALVRTPATGAWEPVVWPRPITTKWDTAGPGLSVRGRRSRMVGVATRVTADGAVEVTARFLTHGGRLLRRALVTFAPTPCGVQTSVAGRAGDTWEQSGFFPTRPVAAGDRAVGDGRVTLSVNARAAVTIGDGYASGSDPRLVRARLRVRLDRPAAVTFSACRR